LKNFPRALLTAVLKPHNQKPNKVIASLALMGHEQHNHVSRKGYKGHPLAKAFMT
jgi:hypothetical protein